jgi:7-carboxy-7-deazaguanine synthase
MIPTIVDRTFTYPLMEHFYTLQGEGNYAGQAAYFIRLGGCDVGCVWCDVKESWNADAHPQVTVAEMMANVKQFPGKIVVVTGGEPTLYPLQPLTDAIHAEGLRAHIETSGAHPLSGNWDWITLSPKKFLKPVPENVMPADELKIVVYHKSDFSWAEAYAALVRPDCKLYLQPEWEKREAMLPLIIDYIQQHPQWQLSLQTHKYINIP